MIPEATPDEALLLDDCEDCVLPEQRDRWIPMAKYASPYAADDTELDRLQAVLRAEGGS